MSSTFVELPSANTGILSHKVVPMGMTFKSLYRAVVLISLCGLILPLSGGFSSAPDIRVDHFDDAEIGRSVRHWSTVCERSINTWFRDAPAQISIRFTGTLLRSGRAEHVWPIAETEKGLELVADVTRGLLARRMDSRSGPAAEAPEWLVSAVVLAAVRAEGKLITRVRGQGIRLRIDHGQFPRLKELVNHPVSPEYPFMYLLHGDTGLELLRMMRHVNSKSPSALLRIKKGTAADAHLVAVLSKWVNRVTDARSAQRWFEDELFQKVYSRTTPADGATIHKRLIELESVSILVPGVGGPRGLRRVAIDEVHLYMKGFRITTDMAANLENGLFRLVLDSPASLVPALEMYMEAVQFLRAERYSKFSAQIRRARKRFEKDLILYDRIEAVLDHYEHSRFSRLSRLNSASRESPPTDAASEFSAELDDYLRSLGGEH